MWFQFGWPTFIVSKTFTRKLHVNITCRQVSNTCIGHKNQPRHPTNETIFYQLTGTCSKIVAQLWARNLAAEWNGGIEAKMSASDGSIVCRTPVAVKGRNGTVALEEEISKFATVFPPVYFKENLPLHQCRFDNCYWNDCTLLPYLDLKGNHRLLRKW